MTHLRNPHHRAWSLVLAVTAVWTFLGAIPSYLDPVSSYTQFHGAPPDSALVLELYRGAWGQTLLFAFGYAFAAIDPHRHSLILVLGSTGKLLYAVRSLATDSPTALATFAAVGDLVFVALIATFLVHTGAARSLVRRSASAATG